MTMLTVVSLARHSVWHTVSMWSIFVQWMNELKNDHIMSSDV